MAHGAQDGLRCTEEGQGAAAPVHADQRHYIPARAFVLHGDRDPIASGHGQVPDAQPVQRARKLCPLQEPAAAAIDVHERRRHRRQVELHPRRVGVRGDASVRDHQRLAVGQQGELVRADPVGRELAGTPVAFVGYVDPDHALPFREVVLARVEQAAVGRVGAVAVEVPVRGGTDVGERAPSDEVDREGEGPGPAREADRHRPVRVERERVSPRRQRQIEAQCAARIESADAAVAGHVRPRGEVHPIPGRSGRGTGHEHGTRSARDQAKQRSAVNPHWPPDRSRRIRHLPATDETLPPVRSDAVPADRSILGAASVTCSRRARTLSCLIDAKRGQS